MKKHIYWNHLAIYGYKVTAAGVELRYHSGVITVTEPEEVSTIERWISEAKRFAKNRAEVCTYLEYMLDYGQYEE